MMPEWTKTPDKPVSFAFLIFDQFSNLCLANCLEPLRAANTLTETRAFNWKIYTHDGAPALSSSGLQVLPHASLSELEACDYLFVTASYGHEGLDTRQTRRDLRRAARLAEITVGLDTGPWLMASAGLLDGRRATVHWDVLDAFSGQFRTVDAVEARVVSDGPRVTCAGAMSAFDLTLGLISTHLGLSARLDVEGLFIYGDPPSGMHREGRDPLVRKALKLMRENPENPLNLTQLAQKLSCQPRTLDRHFRRALGAPPGEVYRHLRLSMARKLLEGTTLNLVEIALRCGYESPAALSRAIRKLYGAPPKQLRQQNVAN
jgi:transcriptional regulator GlxA family with amidase domain